jgi:glutaminase
MRPLTGLLLLALALLSGCATNGIEVPGQPGAGDGPSSAAELDGSRSVPLTSARIDNDLRDVHRRVRRNRLGRVYAGAVDGTRADDFAIAVALVDGRSFEVGPSTTRFPLMSVSKPFTFALVARQLGVEQAQARLGVDATGMPYNSMVPLVIRDDPLQNPLVNAGAIAAHSFVQGPSSAAKTASIVALYSDLAGEPLAVEQTWRVDPAPRTYALGYQMKQEGLLEGEVDDVARRYLASNIVAVDAAALAQMGATLATGGVRPDSGRRVLDADSVRAVLSVMVIAGMYEDSGQWWSRAGVPAKSGVSGAVLAVVPGWGAIAAYSPRLDEAGNSVRAAQAIEQLVERWDLHSIDRLISLSDVYL